MPPLLLHAAVIAALLLASANAHGVLLSPRRCVSDGRIKICYFFLTAIPRLEAP